MERKSVNLKHETWEELDNWRSPGQSFDGAIRELLSLQEVEVAIE